MRFKLVHDSETLHEPVGNPGGSKTGSWNESSGDEDSDLFRSEAEVSFSESEGEANKWGSDERKEEWTVEKKEVAALRAKKKVAMTARTLTYSLSPCLLTAEGTIRHIVSEKGKVYVTDTCGNLYEVHNILGEPRVRKISIADKDRQAQIHDVIVQGDTLIAFSRRQIIVLNTTTDRARYVSLPSAARTEKVKKIISLEGKAYGLICEKRVLVHSMKTHTVLHNVEVEQTVIDAAYHQDSIYVLTEEVLHRYCLISRATVQTSEVLVGPSCVYVFDTYLVLGLKMTLSVRRVTDLEKIKDYDTLDLITRVAYLEKIQALVYGDTLKNTSIRMLNLKKGTVITNFPPPRALSRITAFCTYEESENQSLLLCAGRRVFLLRPGEKEAP